MIMTTTGSIFKQLARGEEPRSESLDNLESID